MAVTTLVLTNPSSRQNRGGFEDFAAEASAAGFDHVVLGGLDSLDTLFQNWSQPDRLVINGGDGTVHHLFTALHRAGVQFPELMLLPGGTTNMTAHNFAGGPKGSAALRRSWTEDRWVVQERVALAVTDIATNSTQVGFFFGAGAIVAGIRYTHERVYRVGFASEVAPGLAVGRVALGLLRREPEFMAGAGVAVRLAEGSEEIRQEESLVLLVTPLTRLFLGFSPWWGGAEHDGTALRLTLVGGSANGFVRNLPGLLRGRPASSVSEASGYFSRQTSELQVDLEGPYTLDGELYPAPEKGLRLSTVGPLRFLVPEDRKSASAVARSVSQ